jgi:hypothetical protein
MLKSIDNITIRRKDQSLEKRSNFSVWHCYYSLLGCTALLSASIQFFAKNDAEKRLLRQGPGKRLRGQGS